MQTTYTDEKTAFRLNQEFKRHCPLSQREIELLKREITDIIRKADPDASLVSLTPNLSGCWNVGFWCHSELYLIPFEIEMLGNHDLFLDAIVSQCEQLLH